MPDTALLDATAALQHKRTYISHRKTGPFHSCPRSLPLGRLLLTEQGIVHIQMQDKIWLIPSWYCAWIPANMEHAIWSNSKELFVRDIFFESHFCESKTFHVPAIFNGSELFRSMIKHTEKWNENKVDNYHELTFTTAIRQMLPDEMKRAFNVSLHSSHQPDFQRALEHIHTHYPEEIRIADVAKMSYHSVRSLQRLFEQEAGLSFSSYVKTTRILKAIELLSTTGKSIADIAWEVGYSSLPTFSNTFKSITGQSPDHFSQRLLMKS